MVTYSREGGSHLALLRKDMKEASFSFTLERSEKEKEETFSQNNWA
jgi:hypothetical protein